VNRPWDLSIDVGGENLRGREPSDQVLEASFVEAVLGKNFVMEPPIQRVAKIAGVPCPDRGINDAKRRI
jgi:hypothetical protein